MRLLIFGTGSHYQTYKHLFNGCSIVALLDNDKRKIGTTIDNLPVISPENGMMLEYDAVVILSSRYVHEMRQQLLHLGVRKDVYTYTGADLIKLFGGHRKKTNMSLFFHDSQYATLLNGEKKRIAILSHDLLIGGASATLIDVADILKQQSYEVQIIARRDGRLRERFLQLGLPVMIDPNLYCETLDDIHWKDSFDLLFVNTIHFYHLFLKNHSSIPIVWWLHDSKMIYGAHKVEKVNHIPQGNVSVYAVANMARAPFIEKCPLWKVDILIYGKKDIFREKSKNKPTNEKVVFAIIGGISNRKGHDIFIRAVKLLPDVKRKNCNFWIIGNQSSAYAENVLSTATSIPEIIIFGEVDDATLQELYGKISVLVCPSREDTMPGVCAEAMMYHHPCIVSDSTGTADYIIPEENGLICATDDALDLASEMEWMIDHASCIPAMGKAARRIYEEHFSMEQFENNILRIINQKLKV